MLQAESITKKEQSGKIFYLPEDVMVSGFDGDELAHCHVPQITTVERRLGYEAVRLLMKNKEPGACEKKIVSTKLPTELCAERLRDSESGSQYQEHEQ